MDTDQPMSFADVRKMIIQTIIDLRGRQIDATHGLAIAANLKCLNDNVQVEINAAKLALQTEGRAYNFGRVTRMGQLTMGGTQAPENS